MVIYALTLMDLKKEAASRLFAYRKNSRYLRQRERKTENKPPRRINEAEECSAEELTWIRYWKRVIDRVELNLRSTDPQMHRFMIRYFSLKAPLNRRKAMRARHYEIMNEFYVSDSTIYKWRAKIIELVVFEAARSGKFRII